ncbi:MAG TPA: hypothetical protein VN324_12565, partial [Quisquiliibacterium sp.]|nr:hypothetical protein [Quisquiliibacterium sp.]
MARAGVYIAVRRGRAASAASGGAGGQPHPSGLVPPQRPAAGAQRPAASADVPAAAAQTAAQTATAGSSPAFVLRIPRRLASV